MLNSGNEAKELLQTKDLFSKTIEKRTQNEPNFAANEAKKKPNKAEKRTKQSQEWGQQSEICAARASARTQWFGSPT